MAHCDAGNKGVCGWQANAIGPEVLVDPGSGVGRQIVKW